MTSHIANGFKAEFPFGNAFITIGLTSSERRVEVAQKIRVKYPDRVPVIVEKAPNSDVPACTKRKFLVPQEITVGALVFGKFSSDFPY